MRFGLFRKEDSQAAKGTTVGVVIISGSCCIPGMKPFDEQARRVVEQAISETGVEAQLVVMPATRAYFGGAPREVINKLVSDANQGKLGVPAVLVNGEAVSYGVPELGSIKTALLEAREANAAKEKKANE